MKAGGRGMKGRLNSLPFIPRPPAFILDLTREASARVTVVGGLQRGIEEMVPRPLVVLRDAPPSPTLPTTLRLSLKYSNSPIRANPFSSMLRVWGATAIRRKPASAV